MKKILFTLVAMLLVATTSQAATKYYLSRDGDFCQHPYGLLHKGEPNNKGCIPLSITKLQEIVPMDVDGDFIYSCTEPFYIKDIDPNNPHSIKELERLPIFNCGYALAADIVDEKGIPVNYTKLISDAEKHTMNDVRALRRESKRQ